MQNHFDVDTKKMENSNNITKCKVLFILSVAFHLYVSICITQPRYYKNLVKLKSDTSRQQLHTALRKSKDDGIFHVIDKIFQLASRIFSFYVEIFCLIGKSKTRIE